MDLRDKFKIQDDVESKQLRIRWSEENKQLEKTFRYKKCGKIEAVKRAEEFRKTLLAKFY